MFIPKRKRILGEKVTLSPMKRKNIRRIFEWANSPEVIPYWYGRQKTLREIKQDYRSHYFSDRHPYSGRCFTISVDEVPIGMIAHNKIDKDNKSTDIDIVIGHKDHWGKGYGTDALKTFVSYLFRWLCLNRIWLATYVHNKRAISAYKKVGFKQEGILREDALISGQYVDSILFSILRSEWENTLQADK
jgi:RimJ/RimL family protein N-acetyltransferase